MTSFTSALSLFVLALVSGCFTLPITENPLSDTSSPFYNDITTNKLFGERMVFDDATMSSTSVGVQRSSDEFMGFETSSMFDDATRVPRMLEDATHESRMLVDIAAGESSTFLPTTEGSFRQEGEMKDSSMMTIEPTTERVDFIPRDFGMDSQNDTEVATESSHSKRDFDDSVFATSQSSEQLFTTIEPETSSMEMQMDFTTDDMSSFTSTSSAVAPELYTREPSTTRKYTGLLADKEDQEEEKVHNDEEHKKVHEKHEKKEGEMEEHQHEDEEHEKPHGKHHYETEEHKEVDEVKKDKKHKKVHTKQGKDELEMEEHKKEAGKESSEEKKFSEKHGKGETEMEEHKQEGDKEVEEGRQPQKHDEDNFGENVEVAEPKDLIKKRPTTFRKTEIESDDGIQYPKAIYDQDAWKKVGKIPSDIAILDETSDVVTVFNKLDSLYTAESHTEESKLNQGEESSRAE